MRRDVCILVLLALFGVWVFWFTGLKAPEGAGTVRGLFKGTPVKAATVGSDTGDKKESLLLPQEIMKNSGRSLLLGIRGELLKQLGEEFQTLVTSLEPSVVSVEAFTAGMPPRKGSGFFISSSGHVLTSHALVVGAEAVRIRFADGRIQRSEIVGQDIPADLALLSTEDSQSRPVRWGGSDELPVGARLVVLSRDVSGQIQVQSAMLMGREHADYFDERMPFEKWLKVELLGTGKPDGALVANFNGQVVGMLLSLDNGSGPGVALVVPSQTAGMVAQELLQKGEVRRGYLGLSVQDLGVALARSLGLQVSRGALVSEVTPGDPADKAGILPGDVILAIGAQKIGGASDYRLAVSGLPAGIPAGISLVRNGRALSVSVMPENYQEESAPVARGQNSPAVEGGILSALEVAPVSDYAGSGVPQGTLKIVRIHHGGISFEPSLQEGDLLLGVGNKKVEGRAGFEQLKQEFKDSKLLRLQVERKGWKIYVAASAME